MSGTTDPRAPLDTQVVVVGAGPVGLLLAGELRLGGADVVVLERLTEPSQESRATTLHARTMELFDQRGLLDRIGPMPPCDPRGHFGGIPMDLGGVDSAYAGQWKVPQTRTREVLLEWATELGAEVRAGHELVALTQDGDRVLAGVRTAEGRTLRIGCAYLVGCDGEDSTVRRLAAFAFPGVDATRELLRADVAGIDIPDRRFERFPDGLAIAGRRPDGVTRVMVHRFGRPAVRRTAEPEFAEVVAVWREVTGEDIGSGTPLWVNAFGDARRQADRYRMGRVLLAGDAAHVQMPVGGQALNLGLQDAANLGWKLAAEVAGRAPERLLDTYHEERHAVGRQVLDNIAAQSAVLLGGGEVSALRTVLAELLRHDSAVRQLAGRISGVDLRSAGAAGASDRPWSGARLAPAELVTGPGAVTSTTQLLRAGSGLLIDTDPDAPGHAELRAQAALWADRVRVVVAGAAPDSEPARLGAVLVRPDGHIAWARAEGPAAALDALRRWFGAPRALDTVAGAKGRAAPGGARTARPAERTAAGPAGTSAHVPPSRRQKMGTLENKTALVTGSSRGIGRAVAERLAAEGALVVVHYARNKEAAEDTVSGIRAGGGRAFAVRATLGAAGDVDALFDGVEEGLKEHTGGVELDIVVNNAGIMGGVSPEDTTPELFDRLVAVNAKAPFFIVQRALRTLRDGGRIINITSGLTRFANPEEIAYAMTKGAVETMARHYAKHLAGRGITVNSVAPGVTNNGGEIFDDPQAVQFMAQLSAFNRVGEPSDIADVVAFLASDASRWITGAFVDATGGTLL
ncbi:SDR family oxidoreductase [Streptomyces sp. enrichment culture]|uniref:SDR family oxidoreductase n=1 Tax=Streptomyces sp. enrichment culture TaxID=1795815 RepID=UPI003F568165